MDNMQFIKDNVRLILHVNGYVGEKFPIGYDPITVDNIEASVVHKNFNNKWTYHISFKVSNEANPISRGMWDSSSFRSYSSYSIIDESDLVGLIREVKLLSLLGV